MQIWCLLKCLSGTGRLFAFPVVGVIAAADLGSGGVGFLKNCDLFSLLSCVLFMTMS